MATVDSYSELNKDTDLKIAAIGAFDGVGQAFTGNGNRLDTVQFYLKRTGSDPSGSITVQIQNIGSGVYGSTAAPAIVLANANSVLGDTIGTSYALAAFTFEGAQKITLENTRKYFATIIYNGGDGSTQYIEVGSDSSSPTHNGNAASYNGITWSSASIGTQDLVFYVNGTAPSGSTPGRSLALTGIG